MKKEKLELIEESKVPKLKMYGKVVVFLVLLIVAVVAMVCLFLVPNKKIDAYIVMDSTGIVYVTDFKSPKDLDKGVVGVEEQNLMIEDILDRQSMSGIQVDENLEYVYYPIGGEGIEEFELYQYEYKTQSEPVLVDRNVIYYEASEKGMVVYQKKDASVYMYDNKENKCVTNYATSFWLDENGNNILWEETNIEGNKRLYYVGTSLKKEEQEISASVDDVVYVSKDLKTILVKYEDDLYCISDLKKNKLIANKIDNLYGYNEDTNSFYYTTNNNFLYYFNGKTSEVVYEQVQTIVFSEENLVVFQKDSSLYIVNEGNMARVDINDVNGVKESDFLWNQEKQICYFLDAFGENKRLYAISASSKKLGLTEIVDTNIEKVAAITEDGCYYIKDGSYVGSSFVGDLYNSGECIVETISVLDVNTSIYGDEIYYYKDFKMSDKSATLMNLEGTKSKEIAVKVMEYCAYDDKTIMFLAKDEVGEIALSYYNGNKVTKVLGNVSYFYSTEEPKI